MLLGSEPTEQISRLVCGLVSMHNRGGDSTSSKLVSEPLDPLAGIAEDNGLRNPKICTEIGENVEPQVFSVNSYVELLNARERRFSSLDDDVQGVAC